MSVRQKMVAAIAAAGAISAAGLMALPAAQASPARPGAQAKPANPHPFIDEFHHINTVVSTVPKNGDQNPYGVFVVRQSTGRLHRGDVLVSNFNAKSNEQGTGKTIVEVSPSGHRTLFAHISNGQVAGRCPGGVGLTTALEVLNGGWVVVGSTPSSNGMAATAQAGCLIVLNRNGQVAETFHGHGINGPWDSTVAGRGNVVSLFVTNILNGGVQTTTSVVNQGTVLRLTLLLRSGRAPQWTSTTEVASGLAEQQNSTAFVLGPTGVGIFGDRLFIADTQDSTITAVSHPVLRSGSSGPGAILTSGGDLNAPLGLAIAPNGDILTVNGNDGRIVETTPAGAQIAARYLDRTAPAPLGAGALFGLAVKPGGTGIYFVDDDLNNLRLLH